MCVPNEYYLPKWNGQYEIFRSFFFDHFQSMLHYNLCKKRWSILDIKRKVHRMRHCTGVQWDDSGVGESVKKRDHHLRNWKVINQYKRHFTHHVNRLLCSQNVLATHVNLKSISYHNSSLSLTRFHSGWFILLFQHLSISFSIDTIFLSYCLFSFRFPFFLSIKCMSLYCIVAVIFAHPMDISFRIEYSNSRKKERTKRKRQHCRMEKKYTYIWIYVRIISSSVECSNIIKSRQHRTIE